MGNKKIKNMTSEEILNSMKDVKVTNLKDGDVLVGDGKSGMINKPLKEVEKDTFKKIIKLNEELTAENAKLCQSNDDLSLANESLKHQLEVTADKLKHASDDAKMMHNVNNDLLGLFLASTNELTSIKSKWWYKLMTWVW